ncbi:D-isomer specific 2-hydroxyacid dehydrogenase, NAD-binding protein [Niveomyces insectorum RCEF 264]|uniref:D-isomer specific 2-hydroxyacid dehydrogenase, NAD-binding protein n=1 Tax=Niveomyces insectorum RCEF 264 TaxID=1081102 RepID=A0A167UP44_9HYPO|nr:D-isomer specific 2-hydroxyacid dehydrogenase, NAD-binding protein [Niveomyces insectorum RCEF 264]
MAPIIIAVFSSKSYDKEFLSTALVERNKARAGAVEAAPGLRAARRPPLELVFHDFALNIDTVPLARGATAVCVFVNDALNAAVLTALHAAGVRAVLLRCAGYNNVDLPAAERLGLFVANVPSYAPEAVAEFSVALLQTLNRQTHRAYGGAAFVPTLDALLPQCDFVSLHCPLTPATRHIVNARTLALMKPGALLVNTSRGGLLDTRAVIAALKSRRLGGVALDVYESEGTLFYNDHSGDIIDDDELMRLMTFPNVIVCGHQAFFTEEALTEIATGTLRNLEDYLQNQQCPNSLVRAHHLFVRRDSYPVRT